MRILSAMRMCSSVVPVTSAQERAADRVGLRFPSIGDKIGLDKKRKKSLAVRANPRRQPGCITAPRLEKV